MSASDHEEHRNDGHDDSGEETDDELPTSSVAELTVVDDPPPVPAHDVNGKDDDDDGDGPSSSSSASASSALLRDVLRSRAHPGLRAYEAKRRSAYESKLQSSALYWHAFRTLMQDSVLETGKVELLLRGWEGAARNHGASMGAVGGWRIDERTGAPIVANVDHKSKRRHQAVRTPAAPPVSPGGNADEAAAQGDHPIAHNSPLYGGNSGNNPSSSSAASCDYYREERCGSLVRSLADSAADVAERYDEFANYMEENVLPGLTSLLEHLKSEVTFMEKLGDSIINELETAEDAVCDAWESYYNKTLDFSGSSEEDIKRRLVGAHGDGSKIDEKTAVVGCVDVWVEEMRYRMAVAFLSSVWEKCSSELSKLFLSMKDAECNRRKQLKEHMINTARWQERLWAGLPTAIDQISKELVEWPMERKSVEDDVQQSIRERAQSIQLDEVNSKRNEEAKPEAPGLSGVSEDDGNFELSSPLVSDLICKAKVVEKRAPGMMSAWKVSLAIITSDSFLQLFELPHTCKLQSGSAPEVAFQNLIPPVVVPSMEGVKGGVKFPTAKYWFDYLVPSESFMLPNCTVSLKDEKHPTSFELVETVLTSGASKMFTKTVSRKMQFRAVTREEAKDFVDELKRSKLA